MESAHCTRCGVEIGQGLILCVACASGDRMPALSRSGVAAPVASGIVVAGAVPPARRPLDGARAWARGRNPWLRLPLLAWFGYILVRHLGDPDYESLFGGLNLVIHEAGHLVFGWFGEFPGVAGGTILQVAAPVIAALVFWRQRDRFAVAVAACWLSTNLFNVARYAGDARAQELPLVSPTSGDPLHDWHYMLGRLGMLKWDTAIARDVRGLAVLSMVAGIAAGGWLLWQMIRLRGDDTGVDASGARP